MDRNKHIKSILLMVRFKNLNKAQVIWQQTKALRETYACQGGGGGGGRARKGISEGKHSKTIIFSIFEKLIVF